jgi:hypothetical protein
MLYCSVRVVVLVVDLLFLSLGVFEFCERMQARRTENRFHQRCASRSKVSKSCEISIEACAQPHRAVVTRLPYVYMVYEYKRQGIANMDEGKTPWNQYRTGRGPDIRQYSYRYVYKYRYQYKIIMRHGKFTQSYLFCTSCNLPET